MNARQKMIDIRKEKGLSQREMALQLGISATLLDILESGGVTSPIIVDRKIAPLYGLSELEAEELYPEDLRPHSPRYDPEPYIEMHEMIEEYRKTWMMNFKNPTWLKRQEKADILKRRTSEELHELRKKYCDFSQKEIKYPELVGTRRDIFNENYTAGALHRDTNFEERGVRAEAD